MQMLSRRRSRIENSVGLVSAACYSFDIRTALFGESIKMAAVLIRRRAMECAHVSLRHAAIQVRLFLTRVLFQ